MTKHNPFNGSLESLRLNADIMDVRVRPPHRQNASRHIGCPLSWFKRVFPVVRGKNELAVALYLYRLRSVQHRRTVVVSNAPLLAELGIDRYAKYRALKRLAGAGIVTLKRDNKRAITIVFHEKGLI
jgi:hypothetical protein